MNTNFFNGVKLLPPDPIFGLSADFLADTRPSKINLGAGVYRTAELKPLILKSVKNTEKILLQEEASKDYLPIDGEKNYLEKTRELVFGSSVDPDVIYASQSLGATSALKIGGIFLGEQKLEHFFIPDPTWENHARIFKQSGLKVSNYPYYLYESKSFDYKRLLHFINHEIPKKSVLVLHACCHNPTGLDPSEEEWKELLFAMQKKELFPFFDLSYQGFGVSLEKDAFPIRFLAGLQAQFAVAVSHGKNFGLYAERPGALFFVCKSSEEAKKVESQVKALIRGCYSNPPCHGSRIIATILGKSDLKAEWLNELEAMRTRIEDMRKKFVESLQRKAPHYNFDYMSKQKGMFSFTGLSESAVDKLLRQYAIYLPKNGRLNVAGLNESNLEYVSDSMATCF